ncbi:hypothetical protein NECID01_0691 [Nematocida sp. AWRm77]|nr:hypothetical protein NECID01_0691 [Nematocida sp. AWRm77]
MVLLNALKVLSAETQHTFSLTYAPGERVQKEFLFPSRMTVMVEVFPMEKVSVFALAEPVYYVDAYLSVEKGSLALVPCPASSFYDASLAPQKKDGESVSASAVEECIGKNIEVLVGSALRKAGASVFGGKNAGALQTVVFLIKLNRLCAALQCIEEEMSFDFSLGQILPYLVYEMFCKVCLERESSFVMPRLVQLSSALNGKLSQVAEDRVINAILVGLKLSLARRPARMLDMCSQVRVSPEKKALFFFLISKYLGSEYSASKCGILSQAREAFACRSCSPLGVQGVKSSLQTAAEMETPLRMDRPLCDHALDEYIHTKGDMPDPQIVFIPGIGVCSGVQSSSVFVPSSSSETLLDGVSVGYTEGQIQLQANMHVSGITVEMEHAFSALMVSEDAVSVSKRKNVFLSPLYYLNNRYTFFLPESCRIKQVHLKHKNRAFSKDVHTQVHVLPDLVGKSLYAHQHMILPVLSFPDKDVHSAVSEKASKLSGLPVSVVSSNPTTVRAVFKAPPSLNSSGTESAPLLYKDISLEWSAVKIANITRTEKAFEIVPLFKPLFLTLNGNTTLVPLSYVFSIPRDTPSAKLFWMLCDRSKSGTFLLKNTN